MDEARALKEEYDSAYEALRAAAKNGRTDAMRCLATELGAGPAANGSYRFDNGHSPLHYAAVNGHCDTVRALVTELGAPVDIEDSSGETPLHWAANKRNTCKLDVVRLLGKELGANIEARSHYGVTPLFSAASNNLCECVRVLGKELGADPNAKCDFGKSPLYAPIQCGHFATLHVLVNELGATVVLDQIGRYDFELCDLHEAARRGDENIFCLLLAAAAGADAVYMAAFDELPYAGGGSITCVSSEETISRWSDDRITAAATSAAAKAATTATSADGRTAMHYAAQWCGPTSLRALAALGADVEARCNGQKTPLHYSVADGGKKSMAAMACLLAEPINAKVDAVDGEGSTPLHIAAACASDTIPLRALLAAGADVNVLNNEGDSSLLQAMNNDSFNHDKTVEALRVLLDNGADASVGCDGILHHVAARRYAEKAKVLLDECSCLDVNKRNAAGCTPLALAKRRRDTRVADALKALGAVDEDEP